MSNAKIIEELSQFYDIKQKVVKNSITFHYIVYCGLNICLNTSYSDGNHLNKNNETLKAYIDRIMLLIDKLNEIFEFTYKCKEDYGLFSAICIGNFEIYFQFRSYICINNLSFECYYSDVCDVIEYLKQACPEYIKSTDIKIALK
jgi:hypothetical protein